MIKSIFIAIILLTAVVVKAQTSEARLVLEHKPYLQALTDSTVTVVWSTNKPSVAWVELLPNDGSSFYQEERPRYHDVAYGFKRIDTLHQVRLEGLKPNTTYRYRVYAQDILKHKGNYIEYGEIVANDVWQNKPYQFTTAGVKDTLLFFMVNDIHGDNALLKDLVSQNDLSKTDFAILNGDMANQLLSKKQMFTDFMNTTSDLLNGSVPFYYARGNHETRGQFAFAYPTYFPTSNNKLYYTFSYNDILFIVLDPGEDKPDTDLEYYGITRMDDYRTEQAEWLAKLVLTPAFQHAKHRIVISHMPPVGDWHGAIDWDRKISPILNKAKIDIMLSAHWHVHKYFEANAQHQFPILINSNVHVLKGIFTAKESRLDVLDRQGKKVTSVYLKK